MSEPIRTTLGPFETSAQAFAAARPLAEAIRAADPGGAMTNAIRNARHQVCIDYVTAALIAAGVELGTYDRRVTNWVADWEPELVLTILGWVDRAHAELLAEAAEAITPCPVPNVPKGFDCCSHGTWPCPQTTLAWRLRGLDPDAERHRQLSVMWSQFADLQPAETSGGEA